MPEPCRRRWKFRRRIPTGRRVLAGIIVGTLCIGVSYAADEGRESPPYHPYLAPARSLVEMVTGDHVERAIERSARVLFPELGQGILPATDFGVFVLPSNWPPHVVLFRETDGGTLVERRALERGIRLRDLTPNEAPSVATEAKSLHAEIAVASISAIRRALVNARLHRPGNTVVLDGVSYYFFSGGNVGSARSPGSGTEAGKLVELAWVLEQFVLDEAEERDLWMAAENALRANHGSMKDR